MNISKISTVSFRAETQAAQNVTTQNSQPSEDKSKTSKVKEFLNTKNAPYIIGGVAVTAATVMGIVGYKKGWFSRAAKQTIKKGEEALSQTRNNTGASANAEPRINPENLRKPNTDIADEVINTEMSKVDDSELLKPSTEKPKASDTPAPQPKEQTELEAPKQSQEKVVEEAASQVETNAAEKTEAATALENNTKSENINPTAAETEVKNTAEVKSDAALNEVKPQVEDSTVQEAPKIMAQADTAQEVPEITTPELEEKISKLPAYLTKFMTKEDIVEAAKAGKIEMKPFERLKAFISDFDNSIEDLFRKVTNNYVVDNINHTGTYRYKEDYVKAFEEMIANPDTSLHNSKLEVLKNSINLTKPDGKKLIYTFKEGEKGGLLSIEDLPKAGENTAMKIHFYPERYWDYGRGCGINRMAKVEYRNTDTNNIIQSVSIHPTLRSFHKVELNDPISAQPVLRMSRTARTGELNYFAVLFENGKPFVKFSTNQNSLEYLK